MDEINLAQLMIDYSNKRKELTALEDQIKAACLELQKSFKIGDVSAVYYGPSTTVDYEAAARTYGVDAQTIAKNTQVSESISWKGVCEDAFIIPGDIFKTVKPPRVVVK
jgi:hypothetical protein